MQESSRANLQPRVVAQLVDGVPYLGLWVVKYLPHQHQVQLALPRALHGMEEGLGLTHHEGEQAVLSQDTAYGEEVEGVDSSGWRS